MVQPSCSATFSALRPFQLCNLFSSATYRHDAPVLAKDEAVLAVEVVKLGKLEERERGCRERWASL